MTPVGRTSEKAESWGVSSGSELAEGAVVIGFGGNVGDVRAHFRAALMELRNSCAFGRVSSLYTSAPIGPRQADFLNGAVLLGWPGPLSGLLELTRRLEAAALRERGERWGPRTLDLDILWAQGRVCRTSSLTVPHPRLVERRFALQPLLDVAPEARDPLTGERYAATVLRLEKQDVRRLNPGLW